MEGRIGEGRIVIYRRADGRWDWRLRASNGEIVATSGGQGFSERNDALEGARRVFGSAHRFEFQMGGEI